MIVLAMMAMGQMFIGTVTLQSLAYDFVDVMDDDNLAITLEDHIQIIAAFIDMSIYH